jgi:hypothetical protein
VPNNELQADSSQIRVSMLGRAEIESDLSHFRELQSKENDPVEYADKP